ncbi:hypothetical protein BSL78_24891 [Apostichopus japonicus]|uniref:Integrase catalytic domain-containing protein n=1 Tax=Stichopus japonicus TaxID=307972 RepID=A0A2G8JR77_STIJA|nr:hypothetical protein BSL78_24891 [Apostichopus japonicus]
MFEDRVANIASEKEESARKGAENSSVSAAARVSKQSQESLRGVSFGAPGKCYFCGYKRHPRSECPARDEDCNNCGKKGHFWKMCRSSQNANSQRASTASALFDRPTIASAGTSLTRSMIEIKEEGLEATFAYLDDVTVGGANEAELVRNQAKFLDAARRKNITFNENKSVIATKQLSILGYVIEDGELRPDPERLRPLKELPIPQNLKALRRCMGMFAYYARWIPNFSSKVKPLTESPTFPLGEEAVKAFDRLKADIENSVVTAIDETIPFEVETDASGVAIAATLNQAGRPVAFFSRPLNGAEKNHPAVEKEALAIIEAVRHWSYYLIGRRFKLTTDQKSVSYVFDIQHKGKIKNEKMRRWRIELSCFTFDIVYRPGSENIPPDTLTRAFCSAISIEDNFAELHNALCHPGVTRMWHFIKSKNLPFGIEEVRKMTAACKVCAKLKPRFYKPCNSPLVKATQPFERLNIDFKGPLPSTNRNIYFLTVVDEFSRFPFIFPCSDMTSSTVIACLCQVFSLFGTPAYIHSDRGAAFLSKELTEFLMLRVWHVVERQAITLKVTVKLRGTMG